MGWVGTAAVAGVAVAVIAAVGVVVAALVLASGDSDASPFAASSQSAPAPVVSCDSGIAVTSPATNTELVGDCEALLGLRDTLRGTGKLNWTAGKAISEWIGRHGVRYAAARDGPEPRGPRPRRQAVGAPGQPYPGYTEEERMSG